LNQQHGGTAEDVQIISVTPDSSAPASITNAYIVHYKLTPAVSQVTASARLRRF